MKKGIIYTRVSTKEQVDKTSLDHQYDQCQEYARKHEIVVTDDRVFKEKGESAKIVDRPELQRILAYVQKHADIDYLLIYKIDRLSRNIPDYYTLKAALRTSKVQLISVTEPMEDDPVGRFLEAMLAATAQFDNEIRALRTSSGMKSRIEQGRWPHNAPIGYLKKDGHIVEDPIYGPKIKDLLIRFSRGGLTLAEVSRESYKIGIKTSSGKMKPSDAIKAILTNQLYAGLIVSSFKKGEVVQGLHKPLVDLRVIMTNEQIIKGNQKAYSLLKDDIYPLKNILKCTNCGLLLTGSAPRGSNGTTYPRYSCVRKTCSKALTGKINAQKLEDVHKRFGELLDDLRPVDEKIAKLFNELVTRSWKLKYSDSIRTVKSVENDLSKLRDQRDRILDLLIEESITKEEKDSRISIISEKESILRAELDAANNILSYNEEMLEGAMEFISDPRKFWNYGNTSVKKAIQKFLFPSGIPYDFESGFGTAEKAFTYLLINKIAHKGDSDSNLVAPTRLELVTSGL